jgi:hypothetical protein
LEVFHAPPDLAEELIKFYNRQPCHMFADLKHMRSDLIQYAGVYALYYQGDFPLYHSISRVNQSECRMPIYVGKAAPSGRRTGQSGTAGQTLYSRLREHTRSITRGGLSVKDFKFKVVAMEVDLVSWGEGVLIRLFVPLWNRVISGFGIHAPGSGREQQERSMWDQLHPGRKFAERLPVNNPLERGALLEKITTHCQNMTRILGYK